MVASARVLSQCEITFNAIRDTAFQGFGSDGGTCPSASQLPKCSQSRKLQTVIVASACAGVGVGAAFGPGTAGTFGPSAAFGPGTAGTFGPGAAFGPGMSCSRPPYRLTLPFPLLRWNSTPTRRRPRLLHWLLSRRCRWLIYLHWLRSLMCTDNQWQWDQGQVCTTPNHTYKHTRTNLSVSPGVVAAPPPVDAGRTGLPLCVLFGPLGICTSPPNNAQSSSPVHCPIEVRITCSRVSDLTSAPDCPRLARCHLLLLAAWLHSVGYSHV